MNESTPLRRSTQAPPSAADADNGSWSSSQQYQRRKNMRRRIRVITSVGIAVAVVLYFGVFVRVPVAANSQIGNTDTGSGSAHDSSGSGGGDPSLVRASSALRSEPSAGIFASPQAEKPSSPSTAAAAASSPPVRPASTSAAAASAEGPRDGDDDTSLKSTDLLSLPQAEKSHDDTGDEKDDRVKFVPGFGAPLEKQYAGRITVNKEAIGKLFYWFFEAREPVVVDDETPLLIWLNGGPGASSMTGLLTEMGPYRITPEGKLIPHAHSWTKLGHMLFFDQPVGTGYSSVRDDNGYVNTQDQLAQQLYRGLQGFYRRHPEYASNPVYICGESYAGKYVPSISHYIHVKNSVPQPVAHPDIRVNLTGIAIGNGKMWPVLQTRSVPDFAIALGFIDSQQYEKANADISVCEEFHRQGRHVDAFEVCQAVTDSIYESAGNPFIYDIRKTGNPFTDLTSVLSNYFNSDAVRSALNVPLGTPWISNDGSSFGISANAPAIARHLLADEMLDVPIDTFRDLLDNYKFLFYAGNMDGSSCNNLGVGRMIDRLAWTGTVDYRAAQRQPWLIDDEVAGLAKTSGNMSYVVVLNSGHLVPSDQPAAALDMMRRFINDEPFTSSD